jgi:hypothetical protein
LSLLKRARRLLLDQLGDFGAKRAECRCGRISWSRQLDRDYRFDGSGSGRHHYDAIAE